LKQVCSFVFVDSSQFPKAFCSMSEWMDIELVEADD